MTAPGNLSSFPFPVQELCLFGLTLYLRNAPTVVPHCRHLSPSLQTVMVAFVCCLVCIFQHKTWLNPGCVLLNEGMFLFYFMFSHKHT